MSWSMILFNFIIKDFVYCWHIKIPLFPIIKSLFWFHSILWKDENDWNGYSNGFKNQNKSKISTSTIILSNCMLE